MMKIPFSPPDITEQEIQEVAEALRSGWITTGPRTKKLEQLTGKTIDLSCRVDPAVMGGVRLDYDGKRVDGTVRSRLDAVDKMLKNTVL